MADTIPSDRQLLEAALQKLQYSEVGRQGNWLAVGTIEFDQFGEGDNFNTAKADAISTLLEEYDLFAERGEQGLGPDLLSVWYKMQQLIDQERSITQ